jgi:hypothetical protein
MGGLSFGLHIALVISFVSLFAWGCEGETSLSSSGARRPPMGRPSGYHVIDVVNGGTLTGVVLWSGPLPGAVEVAVAQDEEVCGATRQIPALAVSARGGVRDTVVYLENVAEGRALPAGPFEVAFEGCELVPRVLALPVGATLTFSHREDERGAAMIHNVHATLPGGAVWATWVCPGVGRARARPFRAQESRPSSTTPAIPGCSATCTRSRIPTSP